MSIFSKIKDWLTGGSSKSKSKKSSTTKQNVRKASSVSNYGGGGSSSTRRYSSKTEARYQDREDEEKRRRREQLQKQQERTQALANIAKRTDALSEGKALNAAATAVQPSGRAKVIQKLEEKSKSEPEKKTPPAVKHHSTALGTVSTKERNDFVARKAKAESDKTTREYKAAKLKPRIDEKYSGATKESKVARKQGEWAYDPDVAKYDVLTHPVAESFARGLTSGASFGASELAAHKLSRNNGMDEAEKVYQENKNKVAEFGGEMAGSLAGFGITGDLSKQAVTKVAPRLTERLGAKTTEALATNRFVLDSARREAVRKFGATATEEQIARLARNKAAQLTAALGEDMAINLTTGAMSDTAHAIIDSDNPLEFVKNMGWNAVGNIALGTLPTVAPVLYKNSALEESLSEMGEGALRAGEDVLRNIDNKRGSVSFGADDYKEAYDPDIRLGDTGVATEQPVKKKRNTVKTIKPESVSVKEADDAAKSFSKRRAKRDTQLKERYKFIDEVYDSDVSGNWVFYKNKMGELCVGNPNAEHGRIRDGYGWRNNGDYYGKLTKENFERAKKAFDDENFEPFVSKANKRAKASEPKAEPKKSDTDVLKTYKENLARDKSKAQADKANVQMTSKAKQAAGIKAESNWEDELANANTYDDFVRANKDNSNLIRRMNETGEMPKDIWQNARIEKGRRGIHKISDDEADRLLWERIPENEVQGWFNNADSGYKPKILERIAENPDALNATMNVAYRNYLDSNPKNALPFEEWLDTKQVLYRGTRGQAKVDDDAFSAFTPYREVAERFAGKDGAIEEVVIAPRDTLGSILTNKESEFLVPESAASKAKKVAETKVEPTVKVERKRRRTTDSVRKDIHKPRPVEEIDIDAIKKERELNKAEIEKLREEITSNENHNRYAKLTPEERDEMTAMKKRFKALNERNEVIDKEVAAYTKANAGTEPKVKKEPPKAETQTSKTKKAETPPPKGQPETGIVPKEEAAKTGKASEEPKANKQAKTGESTRFKRNEEQTAKEKARNKRTTDNRERPTQELFEKDYEAFRKKVNENLTKAEEIKRKLRSATSEEEKAELQKQLNDLKSEVRREYSKASMRYHPDRGGSNEWMGKFNSVWDDYQRGSYSSRSFKGAESSTRTRNTASGGESSYRRSERAEQARRRTRSEGQTRRNASAGAEARTASAGGSGGGGTPPPRRNATANGNEGFRRPRGRTTTSQRVVDNIGVVVGKKRQQASMREKIDEFTKTFRTKIADSLAAFEDEERRLAKREGREVDYGAIDKTRRYNSIANNSIGTQQLKWNGDEYKGARYVDVFDPVEKKMKRVEIQNGKSLKAIYEGMDEATENEFEQYLLLRHAPDRIREGKPIFENIILTDGRSLDDPKVCLEEANKLLEKHPEFAVKAEEIYQYTRNELQNRVDAGLLSQKVADEWNAKYPNYVPTSRDGYFSGFAGKDNPMGASDIKAAKGSDYDVRSIKEQLAEATSRNWRDMTMNNLFQRQFGDKLKYAVEIYDGDVETALLENTINLSKSKEKGKYFAEIFDKGTARRVEIDKRFYDAMHDLYKNGRFGNGIDVMTDAVSGVSDIFKKLVTTWNPIFMVKNGMRDFSEALINTRQTKEFLESMPAAMGQLVKGGEYMKAFRNSGVSQSNLVNLEEALVRDKGWLRKFANKFATLQEMVETYPRLVEYMATLKKAGVDISDPNGLSGVKMDIRDKAAANAADITVNFGRSGSVGKMLNRGFVPFFNPSVQGWSKFVRNFSEQRGTKSMLAMMAKATALGAGATVINNYLWGDNPNYQQISARDKATNYIIACPIKKDEKGIHTVDVNEANVFIKIPKSRFAAAYSIPMVNAHNDNDMGWAEMITVAKDQVAPVDPLDSHIFAPFVLAAANKTWYGTPIESDYLEENFAPSERYDANTSYLGRALGKATEKLPKEMQISPKKADYIIDAETGVIGDLLLPALTPSKQGSGNFVNKYVKAPMGNVLKKSFTIDATTQNDLSTRFYKKLDDANMSKNSAKAGNEEHEEYKRINAYSTEISSVNQAIKNLQSGDDENKQKNIYELQKVRNQLMQDALDGEPAPSSAEAMNAVQKYVGTTYAVENFGSSTDKTAMKVYGKEKYGDISDEEMQKKIDADKDFYKGVKSIGDLEGKMQEAGIKSDTVLSKAVALASSGADDDMFGAYKATKQSRTESDNKMNRARDYIKDGGSEDEYVQLEKARKTLGRLTDKDESAELEKLDNQLAKGEISAAEYHDKVASVKYNANISYIGLATSLAQANAPERGYRLYDIKDKNIQKGINLAAMGFTARDYREMAKALDTNGNGYPSRQEVIDYVSQSDVEDKATLFDALYHYQGRNPFGAPSNYTRGQAARAGKANGVEAISGGEESFTLNPKETSGSGYRRYGRRYGGYRGWHGYGGGGSSAKAKVPKPKTIKASSFVKGEALTTKGSAGSSSSKKTPPTSLKRVEAKIELPTAKTKKKQKRGV